MKAGELNAIIRDVFCGDEALDQWRGIQGKQQGGLEAAMDATARCPDDPVVSFLAQSQAQSANYVDEIVESLERGLEKRPPGGWHAEYKRESAT